MSEIILISTTDAAGGRGDALARMLASVERELAQLAGSRCTLALLLQNCPGERLAALAAGFPAFVMPFAIPGMISLSAARNLLIGRLSIARIAAADVVAFPDDDCWYPAGVLAGIVRRFTDAPTLDLWFCRYASRPEPPGPDFERATVRCVVRHASSNTIFVRGRVLARLARFDEQLGVGTANSGGEDLDFALRAHAVARLSAFCDRAAIGHRDKLAHLRGTYYRGSLLVLARYARGNLGAASEYARKVAVGIHLVLRREISPAAFVAANTLAFAELRRSEEPR